ncbi:MAG TPA: LCP family protein [Anaerolineales bacterium]|nr:LCP family protein [Anaerolineales bacterium]
MSEISPQRFPIRQIIFWSTTLAIAIGLSVFVRELTICWRITSLPGIPPASCAGETTMPLETPDVGSGTKTPKATLTPEPLAEDLEYPTWNGSNRINILFVGLRGGEPTEADCPFCTDTLIVLTVDPVTKTAGMLSIPRDMWVNIPGFGYSRINTAWTLGRGSKLPGGGPALTMKTVSHFIGVPIDYYVQVDFDTFVDIIDLIGGVDVHNDETLFVDPVYHNQEFPKVKLTCCGTRHLNGMVALAYARCRHIEQGCKDGDVGRARRQQKVIFGIREKVLSPENFPGLMAQAPQLYNTFSAGIHTNMSLDDAIRLAALVNGIPRENIKNGVIDHSMMAYDNVILGGQNASIMKPLPDKIRILRDEIFTSSGPISPKAGGDPKSLMQADGARIRLLNGTNTAQLDERTASYLAQQGLQVAELGNTKTQSRTTITLYSPKLYTLKFLIEIFSITQNAQILIKSDPTQTVDIEVRLGSDWISKLPSGY